MKVIKNIITLFCLLWVSPSFCQTLFLSDVTDVTSSNTYSNIRPRIVLDRSGDPVICWGSTSGGAKAYVATWNGASFNTPIQINTGSIMVNSIEGPNMAAHGDTIYIVYTGGPHTNMRIVLRASTDGGLTWGPSAEVDSLADNVEMGTFPDVTTDSAGQPVVMYMRQNVDYSNPRYVIRRSTDLGMTFLPEVAVSSLIPGETCDCCYGDVRTQGGQEVYVAFRNNANNLRDMHVIHSADGGSSFTAAIDVDSLDWMISACPSSPPNMMIDGDTVRTVFMSAGGGSGTRVYYSASHRNDSLAAYNWAIPGFLSTAHQQNLPNMAGNGDTIGIVHEQLGGLATDIAISYSTTGSAGLMQNPSISVANAAGNQLDPDLAFRNGQFHIVYANNPTGRVHYLRGAFFPLVGLTPSSRPKISAFPNPALHHIKVVAEGILDGASEWALLNSLGQTIRTQQALDGQSWQFSRENLPSGLYFVQLRTLGETMGTVKIVLE